ncbi:hypothetical protein ACOMHN_013305 [Nucella lapillus]
MGSGNGRGVETSPRAARVAERQECHGDPGQPKSPSQASGQISVYVLCAQKQEDQARPTQPKPKAKKPLRGDDYNPLMGGGSGGACFRPPRRGATGGG